MAELDLRVDRDSDLPLGAQLAARLRDAIQVGTLAPDAVLPSVRDLAERAGVNVNTARAVYQRLEREGIARSEQGRGTFVTRDGAEALVRRELHAEITELESRLVQRPPPLGAEEAPPRPGRGRLLSTEELTAVRNALTARLDELDAERRDLRQRLECLRFEPGAATAERGSAASSSRPFARVRWVSG